MPKPLTQEVLDAKEEYRKFFKKFRDADGISYSRFIKKNSTDARSLSSFVNNRKEVRPISLEKLERLKKELLTNFKETYDYLTEGEEIE